MMTLELSRKKLQLAFGSRFAISEQKWTCWTVITVPVHAAVAAGHMRACDLNRHDFASTDTWNSSLFLGLNDGQNQSKTRFPPVRDGQSPSPTFGRSPSHGRSPSPLRNVAPGSLHSFHYFNDSALCSIGFQSAVRRHRQWNPTTPPPDPPCTMRLVCGKVSTRHSSFHRKLFLTQPEPWHRFGHQYQISHSPSQST